MIKRWTKFLFFVSAFSSFCFAADWVKINEEEGVSVYEKNVTGSNLVAFKGVTVFDDPIEKILWVLKDVEHRKDWIQWFLKGDTLEKRGPFQQVIYQAIDSPWPVSDRDMVFLSTASKRPNGNIQIDMKSIEFEGAPKTVGVRIQLNFSKYVFRPLKDGKTEVTLEIHTDPKGWIPKWLVNIVQRKYPIKLFVALKKQVKKSFVGRAPLPQ